MPRDLREQRARHTLDRERERRMLNGRKMPHIDQVGDKRRIIFFKDVFGKIGQFTVGIAKLCRERDGRFGVFRVTDKFDLG